MTTGTTPITEAVTAAAGAGLCVLPVKNDGTKQPSIPWKSLQTEQPSAEMLERWFVTHQPEGLGVVCGRVSGGLEMLEFEGLAVAEGVYDTWLETLERLELFDVWRSISTGYMERTPSGGLHFLYRVDGFGALGNTKLASRPPTADEAELGTTRHVLIETRGEGGFVIVAPSGGRVHPSGQPWVLQAGGFDSITTITEAQRDALYEAARSLDSMPVETMSASPVAAAGAGNGLRVGDRFNLSPDATEYVVRELLSSGWTHVFDRGDVQHWRRPGKTTGVSATLGHVAPGVLYVFSSSAHPFEPEHAFSPFAVVALLQFGGDFEAAVKWLAAEGYGSPSSAGMEGRDGVHWPECTDLGNARRFVAQHGDDVRYVAELGCWLVWSGHHWREDDTGEVLRRAKQVAESIELEIGQQTSEAAQKERHKWWKQSQSAERLRAMLFLAESEPGIPVRIGDLDADQMVLNCLNGQVDLRTGRLTPSQRGALCTKLVPVEYDPNAECPLWHQFLDTVLGGDTELIDWMQTAVGYTLSGLTTEQCLFFLYGSGANGKSTFTQTVQALMGDYSLAAAPDLLIEQRGQSHPTGVADLLGRRFCVSQEIDDGKRMAETLVKQLTGSDRVRARRMHQDFFEFPMTAKLWLCANHKPEIRGTDYAIWRRMRLVPFTVTIEPDRRDAGLGDKLQAELQGILAWAVAGAIAWHRDGLGVADAVTVATDDYRAESDVLGEFISACCVMDKHATVSCKSLMDAYIQWCESEGERPISAKRFRSQVAERGVEKSRTKSARSYIGIRLSLGESQAVLLGEPNGVNGDASNYASPTDLDQRVKGDASDAVSMFLRSKNTEVENTKTLKTTWNQRHLASPVTFSDDDGTQVVDTTDSGEIPDAISLAFPGAVVVDDDHPQVVDDVGEDW